MPTEKVVHQLFFITIVNKNHHVKPRAAVFTHTHTHIYTHTHTHTHTHEKYRNKIKH